MRHRHPATAVSLLASASTLALLGTLLAETGSSPASPHSATRGGPSLFEVVLTDELPKGVESAIEQAAARWDAVFTDLLAPAAYGNDPDYRQVHLTITPTTRRQGPNQVVTQVQRHRPDDRALSAEIWLGTSFTDQALAAQKDPATLLALMTHEMGHALMGPVVRRLHPEHCTEQGWTGPAALAAYRAAGGTGEAVPSEGPGRCGHHDLDGEVMHPTVDPGDALSAITLGVLADGGYPVDLTRADPYAVPRP